MKFSEIELPSNRKFGFFFALVFAMGAACFYNFANLTWAYASTLVAFILLVITMLKNELFLPLNKLCMRFGFILRMLFGPLVLGIIFFGLFTPIAFVMRISGRDELRLKFSRKASHWVSRSDPVKSESFKNQF